MSMQGGQMDFGFPLCSIGEVASPVSRPETPVPGTEYRQVGVRLWGAGAYERESIDGSETKYAELNRVEAGDIIVNKIWARHGSVSVVSPQLAGCVCSGEFPLFRPSENRLLPEWFYWITRSRWFWHRCDVQSQGTSGKNRIRPDKFLQITIPIPSVDEQRRIVDRIAFLSDKITDAHTLQSRSMAETEILTRTGTGSIVRSANGDVVQLETICSQIIDCLHSNPVYADSGIATLRSPDVGWGKLFLESARKTGLEEYERRTRRGSLEPGDIVLVREGGGTGKAGIIEDGQEASLGQRVMQLRPDRSKVLPRFLLYQWLSPMVQQEQIAPRMKGSASPHLNIGAIRQFSILLPTITEQERVIAEVDKLRAGIDALCEKQAQSKKAMSALMPSILDRAFRGEL